MKGSEGQVDRSVDAGLAVPEKARIAQLSTQRQGHTLFSAAFTVRQLLKNCLFPQIE